MHMETSPAQPSIVGTLAPWGGYSDPMHGAPWQTFNPLLAFEQPPKAAVPDDGAAARVAAARAQLDQFLNTAATQHDAIDADLAALVISAIAGNGQALKGSEAELLKSYITGRLTVLIPSYENTLDTWFKNHVIFLAGGMETKSLPAFPQPTCELAAYLPGVTF